MKEQINYKIYKKNQLERIASEMIAKDLIDNKDYVFANTSYGFDYCKTFCCIESQKKSYRSYIAYVMKRDYETNVCEFIRYEETYYYKTNNQEAKTKRKETLIMSLYEIYTHNGYIYTDSKEYYFNAVDKQRNRYDRKENYYNYNVKKRELKPYTDLYNKAFNFVCNRTDKKIKYGSPLSFKYLITRKNQGELIINYIYRNKQEYVIKSVF